MEDVERLLKGTVEELEKLLNGKNVLGDPIEKGDAVIVPIVSYGFAFGAGGADSSGGGSSGGRTHGARAGMGHRSDCPGGRAAPSRDRYSGAAGPG